MRGKRAAITDETRRMVRAMAGFGRGWEEISEVIGMPMRTAKRLLKKEYQGQAGKQNLAVTMSLHSRACGWVERDANNNIVRRHPPDTVACIWWEKTRMGMREKQEVIISDTGADPASTIEQRLNKIAGASVAAVDQSTASGA